MSACDLSIQCIQCCFVPRSLSACMVLPFNIALFLGSTASVLRRGGIVSLAASALFCTLEAPWLCSSAWKQLSAAVIALGAALWVVARPSVSIAKKQE